ncbi:MAG: hypothetical protein JO209_03700 [Acidisphaera sp.]|nr:hypothetical protein [Acidisphaera sp.]
MRASGYLLAATLFAASGGAALAADQDFTLVNHTGRQIDNVYVSKVSSNSWEEDVMGKDTLDAGKSVDISFARGERGCHWDLLVKYHSGGQDSWSNVNLCDVSTVTLFRDENGHVRADSE